MREELGKSEVECGTHPWRSGRTELLARRFSNAAILDSGRTSRLAGTAEKAEIEVIFETIIKLNATIGGSFHQMNPAARRFGFQAKCAVRRTLIQTQSAVDTLIEFGKI